MNSSFQQIKDITSQIRELLDVFSGTNPQSPSFNEPSEEPKKQLYVLELEKNRYFIYLSEKLPDSNILENCEFFYEYTKKYKPLRIIENIDLKDEFHIDLLVKTYMNMYGYEYVRGGSYSNDPLTPTQEAIIEQELDYIENGEKYEYQFSQISEFNTRTYNSIEEIDSLISKTQLSYDNYLFEKTRYNNLFPPEYKVNINSIIEEDFEWLYEICNILIEKNKEKQTEQKFPLKKRKYKIDPKLIDFSLSHIQKYQKLLKVIHHLYYLSENSPFFDGISLEKYKIYLKYPQFLFDKYFYEQFLTINQESESDSGSLNTVGEFCYILKLLTIKAKNRIDEYRHDLNTYDNSIEWIYPRILYILEKKKRDFDNLKVD